jgi:TonB-linked SusC/RagA family outer membrane protein
MKKKWTGRDFLHRNVLTKTFRVMKLVFFLSFVVSLNVLASEVYSQKEGTLTVNFEDATIEEAIKKIQDATGYEFFYQADRIDLTRKIGFSGIDLSIDELLKKLFSSDNTGYQIMGKHILITGDINEARDEDVDQSTGVTVKGRVTDRQGDPIPGVSVVIQGTTRGTITSVDGDYELENVPEDATLKFSFIGMETRQIEIEGREQIDISMQQAFLDLDEVVVVGYGTQRKADITSSVAVVSEEAFDSRPNTQFGNLIQGKSAGVQVITPSGKPSQGFSIRVRGTSSISAGSEPLYVIDGVPTSDTRSINPSDIESITVLKDASSAAIYGAQGANGVVLITTKKGEMGEPRFEFNSYYGFSNVWKTLDVLNSEQYRDLMTELGRSTDWSRYTHNTDWQNVIFEDGRSQNYQISVSGKNEETGYYISSGWTEQKGVVRSSQMDRFNFKANLDQRVNSWFNMGTNISYSHYSDVDVSDNQAVNQGGVILGMLSTPPNIGIYNEDGTFTSNPFQDWENPVSSTDGSERGYKNQRLLGNIFTEINFIPDLMLRTNLGIEYSNGIYDYFLDPFRTSYGRAKQGIGQNNTNLTNYWIFENTLNYDKSFGKHNVEAMAGAVTQKYRWENSSIQTEGFASDAIITPNAGSTIQGANANKSEKANASYISRVSYNFGDKYLFTGNFRADGSSSFGPGKRWGYFPSFSAGWRVSQEGFMDDMRWLSDLKVRGGWGMVGNDQIPGYAYLGRVGLGANYPIGGEILPGNYPSSIENNDLKWEATEQTNVGIDLAIFNSRFVLAADAYMKKTTGLLLWVTPPRSTGFDSGLKNVGELENKGLEFQVTTHNFVNEFTWSTDFNISFNRNKVKNIIGQQLFNGDVAGRGEVSLTREGDPIGLFYGYVAGGVDPATGMMYYVNNEGESVFQPNPDDRTIIGDPHPDFLYGMTNNFSFKNFDLSVFIQGSQGNDIFNATRIETEGMIDAKNQTRDVINRWREPGQVTNIPRAVADNTDNSIISTRFVEDGSYVRLKALTLAYNVPEIVVSKLNLQNVKVHVSGENLLTLTNYSGYDPEVNAFGTSNVAQGIDYGTYPQTRNFIFGLNVSF